MPAPETDPALLNPTNRGGKLHMKRAMFLKVALTGALLTTGGAFAQAPGGGGMSPGQSPQSSQQTVPQRQSPDATMGTQQNTTATTPQVDDKKFVKEAAIGGLTEVELGKLALQKASDSNVKQFAQKMVDDHTKANDQLKQVASKENIQVPDSLDSKHQSHIDKLSKLSGEQFDKAYVKDQLKDHEKDVREFSNEAQGGNDPLVKSFASSTLPTLQEHLSMVKNLNKSEKQMAKNGTS
jgi:putative membrane protein